MSISLFEDQEAGLEAISNSFRTRHKRPLLVAPTGYGKGTIAGEIIKRTLQKNSDKKIMFVVNRRELVKDMSKRLRAHGIFHGILMGAKSRGVHMNVLVASVDTLRNRLETTPAPDLTFVDEAHLFTSVKNQELFDILEENGSKIIFMTATPWLLSGRGMEQICDDLIEGPQVSELIAQGRLKIPEIYAPAQPDLTKLHMTASGEYDENEAAEVMTQKSLIGDMVAHWKELGQGIPTIGFAATVAASQTYAASFLQAGIRSVAVDAATSDEAREQVWEDLRTGQVDVVWSVGIVSYGWDVPEVGCIILASPTKSWAKNAQQIGRGLRKYPGRSKCIIIDHAGNTIQMYGGGMSGLPDMERHFSLKGWKKRKGEQEEAIKVEPLPRVCPICPMPKPVLNAGVSTCPKCGYQFSQAGGPREAPHIDATAKLVKVETPRVYIYPETNGDKFMEIAKSRGYDPKWAKVQGAIIEKAREDYRAAFGSEPREHWSSGQIRSMLKSKEKQLAL